MIQKLWILLLSHQNAATLTNKWIGNYYLKSDGKMAKNEWVDEIGRYYVESDGKMR